MSNHLLQVRFCKDNSIVVIIIIVIIIIAANSSLHHVRQTECCYEASHFALHNVAIAVHLLKGYKNL